MKENIKKIIIIALPIVFALTAAIAVALMVSGSMKQAEDPQESPPESSASEPPSIDVMNPAESGGNENNSSGLEFTANSDGTSTVSGLGSCRDSVITVPDTDPEGRPVIAIGKGAFMGRREVREVILPASVMEIGEDAFRSSGIESISIGGSVLTIGEGAFAQCLSLTEITVSGANPIYASSGGVLFDREMETLLCYPSGRTDSSYTIPKSVTKIARLAFSSCASLRSVKYGGTEKQWKNVYISAENDTLSSVSMSYAPAEK